MIYIMSCVWLNYMVQYFQYKNCVGSSPKTKKCVASFLVPGYKNPVHKSERDFYFLPITSSLFTFTSKSGVARLCRRL